MTYSASLTRYEGTEYQRVGNSGLKLPRISLGLWNNFGGDRSIESQRAILRTAFDNGVTHFDIANNYGPPAGSAERNFGTIFAEDFARYRDELIISSKAGYAMPNSEGLVGPYQEWGSRKNMLSSLDQSLSRTGLEYFDIFYSHRPDPETPIEETMGALATAVQQGKALYVGISNYSPEQTVAAHKALADLGVPLLIHQPRYSMFDRTVEQGLLSTLADLGVGSIAFSPLAQGLLTNRYLRGSIPADSRANRYDWIQNDGTVGETYLSRVQGLAQIAEQRGQTVAQLAIAWILRQPQVTSALVGASSPEQLLDTLAALDAPALTEDEIAAIEPFAVHGTQLS